MSLSTTVLKAGIETFLATARTFLMPIAKHRFVSDAQRTYDEDVRRLVTSGKSVEEAHKLAESVLVRMTNYAKADIDIGLGNRLRGALAHYEAGNQLECVRHLLLFIGHICVILDWQDASDYLNEQNRLLCEKKQRQAA